MEDSSDFLKNRFVRQCEFQSVTFFSSLSLCVKVCLTASNMEFCTGRCGSANKLKFIEFLARGLTGFPLSSLILFHFSGLKQSTRHSSKSVFRLGPIKKIESDEQTLQKRKLHQKCRQLTRQSRIKSFSNTSIAEVGI